MRNAFTNEECAATIGRWLVRLFVLGGALLFFHQPLLAQQCTPFSVPQQRFGFNFNLDHGQTIEQFDVAQLDSDWYLDYTFQDTPKQPANLRFAQVIRANIWQNQNYTATVSSAVSHNRGALWILGNEPDRYGQDGLLPEEFAAFYHDLYSVIKGVDATSQVAVGAIIQATPLRLHYLSLVLEAYQSRYGQPLPTDVWTIHAFVLRECNTAGCWGASIPPGMEAFSNEGMLYEVEDHGKIEIVQEHVTNFRQWMANHGYQNKPLLITEYGILFPPNLGYPYITVRHFMEDSFDLFLNSKDSQIGYAADDGRLVQAWSWFSLNTPPYDPATQIGFNGNLFDPVNKTITPLGQDFANYVNALPASGIDLGIRQASIQPALQVLTATQPISVSLNVRNQGPQRAKEIVVDVRLQTPGSVQSTLLESRSFVNLAAGCADQLQWSLDLRSHLTQIGEYRLTFVVRSEGTIQELNGIDNQATQWLLVWPTAEIESVYLPVVQR
ncbi:MAG: CARDB domain-containing protein [Caldilineaceae bacterium]